MSVCLFDAARSCARRLCARTVLAFDLVFSAKFLPEGSGGPAKAVGAWTPAKYEGGAGVISGSFVAPSKGELLLEFDNSYSRMRCVVAGGPHTVLRTEAQAQQCAHSSGVASTATCLSRPLQRSHAGCVWRCVARPPTHPPTGRHTLSAKQITLSVRSEGADVALAVGRWELSQGGAWDSFLQREEPPTPMWVSWPAPLFVRGVSRYAQRSTLT